MLYTDKARGAQVRARAQWIEEGEKNTKYFLKLEKARQSSSAIHGLNINGVEENNEELILEGLSRFYGDLYKSKLNDDEKSDIYLKQVKLL